MEERDPLHEDTGIEPDDAKPTGAEGGNGAPAPFETPAGAPKPVGEVDEAREREARGGAAWAPPLQSLSPGRVAQWESARFTRERSQVRNPPRPCKEGAAKRRFSRPLGGPE